MGTPNPAEDMRAGAAQTGSGPDGPAASGFSLAVTGVVVTRAQFVAALQPFIPQLTDIETLPDGERFLLVLSPDSAAGPLGQVREQ